MICDVECYDADAIALVINDAQRIKCAIKSLSKHHHQYLSLSSIASCILRGYIKVLKAFATA